MMTSIQTLGVLFGLVMAYISFLHFKRREFNLYQLVVWEALWIGFLLADIFPASATSITERLGITRAFDLFSIIAFVIILSLAFHNYVLITRLERRLENNVRREALEHPEV